MNLNLKIKGDRKIKSFSLSPVNAEFIEQYSAEQGCSASNFIDQLVQDFKKRVKK